MPKSPFLKIELTLTCARCGRKPNTVTTTRVDGADIKIDPCEHCMEQENNKGYDEGHQDGYAEGRRHEAHREESE